MGRTRAEVKLDQVANQTPDRLGKLTQAFWRLINEFFSMYNSYFYDLNYFLFKEQNCKKTNRITITVEILDYIFFRLFLW